MNLKQMQYFVTIARVGSLSQAAQELNVAQPALSQNLKSLEEELGLPLVDRHSRGVTPNDMGLMLLHHFTGVLQDVEKTQSLITDYADNPSGEVKVGVTTTAAGILIAPLLTLAAEKYPRIWLHAVEGMSGTLREALQLGNLDMAILYDASMLDSENFVVTPIMTEELFLVVRNDGRLRNRTSIPFEMLPEFRLVLPSQHHTLAKRIKNASANAKVPLETYFDVDSFTGMVSLVRAGFESILPYASVSELVEKGEVQAIPIDSPPIQWTVYLATAQKGVRSRAVRTVHKLVTQTMEAMVERRDWPGRLV